MELIKLHPPFTHFAVAMPVALLVVHVYYKLTKRQEDKLHLLFTFLATLSVLSGTLSGMVAHEPIEDKLHQISIFFVHQYLGLFLGAYFVLLFLLRLAFLIKDGTKKVFTIMLILGILLIFLQGYLGGSIVYDHMIRPWLGG
ncbi:MAG: DUF2231 domain-containing protein [Aquificaceae bacterium]